MVKVERKYEVSVLGVMSNQRWRGVTFLRILLHFIEVTYYSHSFLNSEHFYSTFCRLTVSWYVASFIYFVFAHEDLCFSVLVILYMLSVSLQSMHTYAFRLSFSYYIRNACTSFCMFINSGFISCIAEIC